MKYVYKIFILLLLFVGSLFLFSKRIPNLSVSTTASTNLMKTSFPSVYLKLGSEKFNPLIGYASKLDVCSQRESITPLDTSKEFTFCIEQSDLQIAGMSYALYDISDKNQIFTNQVPGFDKEGKVLKSQIFLDTTLDTSTEYALEIVLVSDEGKKLYYYTRVKYYESDFFLSKKMDFIDDFNKSTLDSDKSSVDIASYLEPSYESDDNSTLAHVTIHSDEKLIRWNELSVKQLSTPIPVIKEINIEGASVLLTYYVSLKSDSNTENYLVNEFYRIRYHEGQLYLLYFDRTAEQVFNPTLTSKKDGTIKLGISNAESYDLTCDEKNVYAAYVKSDNLYQYDSKSNKIKLIFSYAKSNDETPDTLYAQHNIDILKCHENGNIDFVVAGYINSGTYEGHVAIILYSYSAKNNDITERVYVPLDTTYPRLNLDFGEFSYVNDKNVFFFEVNNSVYAYNISSKNHQLIAENITSNTFTMSDMAKAYVLITRDDESQSDTLTIFDLITGDTVQIKSNPHIRLCALGAVGENIIYGYVHEEDIYENEAGEKIMPVFRMIISDKSGNVLKKYSLPKIYVSSVETENNVVYLNRLKKNNSKFKKISSDSILNHPEEESDTFAITKTSDEKYLEQKYLSLPKSTKMVDTPEFTEVDTILIKENPSLRISPKNNHVEYYIYTHGFMTDKFDSAANAIIAADEGMGVVTNGLGDVIWERGGQFLSKELSGIENMPTKKKISSSQACSTLLLKAMQVTANAKNLPDKKPGKILSEYLDNVLNLKNCTLSEMLYFVSNERPVIAKLSDDHYCILKAYTETNVTWYNPSTDSDTTMSINNATNLFKEAGNVFITAY